MLVAGYAAATAFWGGEPAGPREPAGFGVETSSWDELWAKMAGMMSR